MPAPGMAVRGVVIRPMRADEPDAERLIAALQAELWQRYGEFKPLQTAADELWPPRGIFLVAWVDGQPAGCGGLRDLGGDVAELKRMYVSPNVRGRGVARALLADLELRARAAHVPRVRLMTGDKQPEAQALYQSAGWTPTELFGEAVEHGWTDVVAFERSLVS